MERPIGLLGQLWDRFGPANSPVSGAASDVVVLQGGPDESKPADEVDTCSSMRTVSLSTPAAPPREQESPAFGSLEDLERYLDETSGG